MQTRISHVEEDSAAFEGGILPGDQLVAINGHSIRDILDYRFYQTEELVVLDLLDGDGNPYCVEVEKDRYEDLGIDFEEALLDKDRGCANRCIFCFIDQMPCGMRETLYFKDDDTRLSFLTGNYVTLTNVGPQELDRLVRYRISPINVSVHTTNPELRRFLLGNHRAGEILEQLRTLERGCIAVNAQIVLCPGINDGDELLRTLEDLLSLSDSVASVSVVPVGLTRYRESLYPLRLYTPEECREIIASVEAFQDKAYAKLHRYFVYAADELYGKAGLPLPVYERYDDFPQLENGVGMAALLDFEVCDYLQRERNRLRKRYAKQNSCVVSIATGAAAYDLIRGLAEHVASHFPHVSVLVYRIENRFFGESVTVSGLLTGRDLMEQLRGKPLGDVLLITENMLRSGEDVLLDDVTIRQLEKALGVRIRSVSDRGDDFVNSICSAGKWEGKT